MNDHLEQVQNQSRRNIPPPVISECCNVPPPATPSFAVWTTAGKPQDARPLDSARGKSRALNSAF